MTDIDRAISRLFVPSDNGFDYYPFGFDRPGYRADGALIEDAARIERSGSQRALFGIGGVGILLYVILPKAAEVHPELIAVANSPIIRIAIALPLLAVVYLVVMARRRHLLRALLIDRRAGAPALTPPAILAHRARHWRTTPWFSRSAMFVAIPLAALAMALYAAQRGSQSDGLAPWEAGLAAMIAIGLVGLYGFVIYRVMSFRSVAPDNN
jgi:hypothetical protein